MAFNLPKTDKKRVVIVGGGFGGLKLANHLKGSGFQVVLVDRNNYHQFPPLIYQVASAGIEPSSIAFPFRKIFQRREDFYFRLAEVRSVFPEQKILQTSIGKIHYDYLVFAAGTTTNFFGNKNVAENAIPMKNVSEAMGLRNALLENFERALTCSSETERQELLNVVIVGGGGAGMTAAIEAANAGKKIVILESQGMAGGNSIRSTGGMNAAKTPEQDKNSFDEAAGVEKTLKTAEEKYADNATITALAATVREQWAAYQAAPSGYFDSVELFELDTMIGGKGINNPELVHALASNSADAIQWLESVGAPLPSVSSFGGASVKRIHRPVNAEGKTVSVGTFMLPILEENAKKLGADLRLETRAKKLLVDESGKIVGVEAEGPTGEKVTVNAKAVILASGGFGANLEMVTKYRPELKGFMTTNAKGALGDGILMGEEVGAATVDLEQIQIHPTVEMNTAALITEGLRGDGAILVNSNGQRFTDEVGTRDAVSAAEIKQPGSFAYLIVDQAMVDASNVIQGYIKKGYTTQGESYAALAEALQIDPTAFETTMNEWNAAVEAKTDSQFGRTSFASPLNTAPYYAIKVTPGVHHTMGGLKINSEAEVLTADGNKIPGLFAAGEVTGGVHGANRLGGNAVADFVVFGRIAGKQAASYLAQN